MVSTRSWPCPIQNANRAAEAFAGLYGCDDAKTTAKTQQQKNEDTDPDTQRIIDAGAQGIARLDLLNKTLKSAQESNAKYPDTSLGRKFKDVAKTYQIRRRA